jgi:hydroxypyruvate reductase
LLLASGATIDEINAVRKHLSEVKGGGLLGWMSARPVVSLILSDVVGDDPAVIGSGPTAADPTTFADALCILERYGVERQVPPPVRDLIERGRRGEVVETVKPGDPRLAGVFNLLIGTNRTALDGASRAARRLGYRTAVSERPLSGDTTAEAHAWIAEVKAEMKRLGPGPACVLAGGETTVAVQGRGKGGRNQEFALALAEPLSGSGIVVLSAGTDGIDGPTDAAGARVDGTTLDRARAAGLDPGACLLDNDSYSFFAALDDLFSPGPTGTNVMDIKIAIGAGSAPMHRVVQD